MCRCQWVVRCVLRECEPLTQRLGRQVTSAESLLRLADASYEEVKGKSCLGKRELVNIKDLEIMEKNLPEGELWFS